MDNQVISGALTCFERILQGRIRVQFVFNRTNIRYQPGEFVQGLVCMPHAGGRRLEDLRELGWREMHAGWRDGGKLAAEAGRARDGWERPKELLTRGAETARPVDQLNGYPMALQLPLLLR